MVTYISRSLQDYVLQAVKTPLYKQTSLHPAPCLFEGYEEEEKRAILDYAAAAFREAGLSDGPVLNLRLDGSLAALSVAEEQIVDAVCAGWTNTCEQLVSVSLSSDNFHATAWADTVQLIRDLSRQTVVFLFAETEDHHGMLRDLKDEMSRLKVFSPTTLTTQQICDFVCSYIRSQGFALTAEAEFRKRFAKTFSGIFSMKQAQQIADILMECAIQTEQGWAVGPESITRAIG